MIISYKNFINLEVLSFKFNYNYLTRKSIKNFMRDENVGEKIY
jgi:hypothetical protein